MKYDFSVLIVLPRPNFTRPPTACRILRRQKTARDVAGWKRKTCLGQIFARAQQLKKSISIISSGCPTSARPPCSLLFTSILRAREDIIHHTVCTCCDVSQIGDPRDVGARSCRSPGFGPRWPKTHKILYFRRPALVLRFRFCASPQSLGGGAHTGRPGEALWCACAYLNLTTTGPLTF